MIWCNPGSCHAKAILTKNFKQTGVKKKAHVAL